MEPRVVARLNECDPDWCEITVEGLTGWVRHDAVWGVYPQEVVE
jgi:SH3-like domain-containing protein